MSEANHAAVSRTRRVISRIVLATALASAASLTACKKAPTEPPRPTIDVTVVTV
ncbi:efflux transporter periplasmic adaptor subunit, partial [Paraburkholderia sp. LEh10]|nr:efflux transporter periplasmic adaptor subunit [Paraburkholderia sp. LEh10]